MYLVYWNLLAKKWVCHHAGKTTEETFFSGTNANFWIIPQNRLTALSQIETRPELIAPNEHVHAFIGLSTIGHHRQFKSQEETEVYHDLTSGLFKKKETGEEIHNAPQILFTDSGKMFV
ncbi:MAG: hypothetical protein K9M36_01300 [Candidatus Pacebacteria bacterium]|nr:hypothetical protein [Candidatus Paceibacterota bacterium]